MNVILVSHCDFSGNSAMHVFSIANCFRKLGIRTVVTVPNDPKTIGSHGTPLFQLLHHDEVCRYGAVFPDGRGPDLIHAWTSREHVRRVTECLVARYRCPYLVHLEDNENAIVEDDLAGFDFEKFRTLPVRVIDEIGSPYRSHPRRACDFIASSAGLTALMDRLLEFKPAHLPGLVFWPGFDDAFRSAATENAAFTREKLGIPADAYVLVYNGNVHASNESDVTTLILAVSIVHRRGIPVRLLKTGTNYAGQEVIAEGVKAGYLMDLGWVARAAMPSLLQMADLLVQPGRANKFNDYRFPSKLPEFLVSGKPVVLAGCNLGRFLDDGVNCILLKNGDPIEIANKIEQLISSPASRTGIGAAGRQFALEKLEWSNNVQPLAEFYRQVSQQPSPPAARDAAPRMQEQPVKLIAFYLPQYHPIPENDQWWGKGFTEWTNATRARPVYPGHHQPQLPADLGFYDLRVPEVMEKQAELALQYGISGFCFYYYWFQGRRLLERPLNQMLASGKPDFPFCVCWANENWTRAWDGSDTDVLVEQHYSPDMHDRLMDDLAPVFQDPRYIRVDGAPLFLVYRAEDIPDTREAVERWRARCAHNGISSVHIAMVQSFGNRDPRPAGFDAAVEFPPFLKRALVPAEMMPGVEAGFKGFMEDYPTLAANQINEPVTPFVRYRGIMPSWDNSARRGNQAHIVLRSSPAMYQRLLAGLVEQTMQVADVQPPLLFINAWNEWAEGTHLEPDQRYGRGWLEATLDGLSAGVANHLRNAGLPVLDSSIRRALEAGERPAASHHPEQKSKTESFFTREGLQKLLDRYERNFLPRALSYATVQDYCDSIDHIRPLATHNGDMKDVQRPWTLKAILGKVPRGGRILEIGAGDPLVADILRRLGYEVWVADPYPSGEEFARYAAEFPDIRFVREEFGDHLLQPPEHAFDCIYSIAVLTDLDSAALVAATRGLKKFLKPDGLSIHTMGHVYRGPYAEDYKRGLEFVGELFGISKAELHAMLEKMKDDLETYYLSAESHHRWRANQPYQDFPMRSFGSIQVISAAAGVRVG